MSMPTARITASMVFRVGLPFSLKERYSCSRASSVMPFARVTPPEADQSQQHLPGKA
ncbi:hypothetical protein ABH904_002946 [Pseudomonas frederiksbergensis]